MAASSTIIIFLVSVSLILSVSDAYTDSINCPAVKCGHDGPDIRFPFYCHGLQNQTCGLPGFGLSCNNRKNTTIIQFPEYNSGELEVKSISYDEKKLVLVDPTNCVPKVFLNLDQLMINLTPFKYYYVTHNFTYLNCSERLSTSSPEEVPCLSGSGRHVYVIAASSSSVVPSSCRPLKTVAIPFSYSHYLSDNSFGLRLTWDQREIVVRKGMNLGEVILMGAAMTSILFSLKYYRSYKKDLSVEEWRMMMKMASQARDHSNNMKEPTLKITMLHNSFVEISVLNK